MRVKRIGRFWPQRQQVSSWWKPWTWGWKTTPVTYSFSIKDVLDGINTGIDFVNDKLMELAKKALNAVNLDFPKLPEIPGLTDLREDIDRAFGSLDRLSADVRDLEDALAETLDGLRSIKVSLDSFHLSCARTPALAGSGVS